MAAYYVGGGAVVGGIWNDRVRESRHSVYGCLPT
jgi:hypothetical protein